MRVLYFPGVVPPETIGQRVTRWYWTLVAALTILCLVNTGLNVLVSLSGLRPLFPEF